MLKLVNLTMIAMSLVAIGCASETPPPQSNTQPEPAASNSGNASGKFKCSPSTGVTSSVMAGASRSAIDGNKLAVHNESETSLQTFCDILLASNKPVGIFQMAGVVCASCQEEARHYHRELAGTSKGQKILHTVVFVDLRAEREVGQVANFKRNYAPNSNYRMDGTQALWSFLSPSKVFGTTVVLDRNGNYFFVEAPYQQVPVMQNAERLAAGF